MTYLVHDEYNDDVETCETLEEVKAICVRIHRENRDINGGEVAINTRTNRCVSDPLKIYKLIGEAVAEVSIRLTMEADAEPSLQEKMDVIEDNRWGYVL